MQNKLKLYLVDDHQMFLDGLSLILESIEDFEIIGVYDSGARALSDMEINPPDVLVTDFNMPEMDGGELVERVKSSFPTINILVLSMHNDRETVSRIIGVEADGYILKQSNKSELVKAIKTVGAGGTYYSNEIMSILLQTFQKREKLAETNQVLSEREKEVLSLIAMECTNDEIADKLFISKRTVETHRKNMMAKTNVNSTVGLLKFGVRNELISL